MSKVRSQTHSIGADHPGEEAVEEGAYPLLRVDCWECYLFG